MFSAPQKALLKRAQRQAGLSDGDYREALEAVTGYRTSTAPELTDRDMDKLLAYFEAIYWHGVDAGRLQAPGSAVAVFRQRGYWAAKNTSAETSRDRFNQANQGQDIAGLEAQLAALGFGPGYLAGIRKNVCKDRKDAHALHQYRAALERTLKSKARREDRDHIPF